MNTVTVSQEKEEQFLVQLGMSIQDIIAFKPTLCIMAEELGINWEHYPDITDWTLHLLPNGGWFYQLKTDKTNLHLLSPNYYECQISPEATSIVINLFAIDTLMQFSSEQDTLRYYYTRLKQYVFGVDRNGNETNGNKHAEAEAIYWLID